MLKKKILLLNIFETVKSIHIGNYLNTIQLNKIQLLKNIIMIIEVKVPSPGESITEVEIANWMVNNGDIVQKDQEVAEIESDKATLPLLATEAGKIHIKSPVGETIAVGAIACEIDTSFAGEASEKKIEEIKEEPKQEEIRKTESAQIISKKHEKVKISPVAEKLMQEHGVSVDDVINGLRRISKKDIELIAELPKEETIRTTAEVSVNKTETISREQEVNRMSTLRRKLSQRLVSVKNETAMLTTFNELDMSAVIEIRNKYKNKFLEKHGVKLGFMSFFTKAVTESLKKYPNVGAMIDGEDLIVPKYCDIAIAVQAPKGLMVPVLRNAETMSLAEIESKIMELATKARNSKLTIEEMTGGTFTITNGGVFGSMLSTPIINPPQSGILGMHNIIERPVAVNGEVKIRPMMYIALSYDHRVIDGATSVGFLVNVKKMIENPIEMLLDGKSPEQLLLGL